MEEVYWFMDIVDGYRGPGEKWIAPIGIYFFPKNSYSKVIKLRHVGPHALNRDIFKVFINMCLDPKKLFAAVCGVRKPKKT